jgi:hypothetical protein
MTKSLPTVKDPDEYHTQVENNNGQMEGIMREFFPDFPYFYTSFEEVFKVITYLEETKVNPEILPRVIRGVHNLLIGTGKGQVIIHINNNEANVEVRETGEKILAR